MVLYAQLADQDKTKGISSFVLSYDVEIDVEKNGITLDEYLRNLLEMNLQFERVYTR